MAKQKHSLMEEKGQTLLVHYADVSLDIAALIDTDKSINRARTVFRSLSFAWRLCLLSLLIAMTLC